MEKITLQMLLSKLHKINTMYVIYNSVNKLILESKCIVLIYLDIPLLISFVDVVVFGLVISSSSAEKG